MFYFDNLRNYVPVNGLERGDGNRSSQKYSNGVRVGYKSQDKIHQNLKAFNFQLSSPYYRMNESPQITRSDWNILCIKSGWLYPSYNGPQKEPYHM